MKYYTHTPEPWKLEEYTGHPHLEIWGKIDGIPQRLAYMQDHVAVSYPNGQVMSAAPQLLRGCQAAIAYLADPPSIFRENREEAIRIIKEAIHEATRKRG
jgi:hypothetical protein